VNTPTIPSSHELIEDGIVGLFFEEKKRVKQQGQRNMEDNLLLCTDSYKVTHHLQYPPGLTHLKAYFESRGGLHPEVVFFGLQYILKKHLCRQVTLEMIDEAEEILSSHFNNKALFNRAGWEYIVKEHEGKIPICVRAVPEGSVVPVKNVLFTVESTDEKVPWVANYFEALFVQTWYPSTVATNSMAQKRILKTYTDETSDMSEKLEYQLHDFGCRGVSSIETAGIGGCAHLVSFTGTDTLPALQVARKYYGPNTLVAGYSVPASEHSTMTSWGKDQELEVARHLLETFPTGPLSVVSDSYDLWHFIDDIIGKDLKDQVVSRANSGGHLVIRPDSGDPVENVLKVLKRLEVAFGAETNSKGFKVLHKAVSVIQGDGISYESLKAICGAMKDNGWSISNILFGSGGALLQKLNRDTQKFAYKACEVTVNGLKRDVFKDPVTDPGKKSKSGDLTLVMEGGVYKTIKRENMTQGQTEQLVTIFENGKMVKEYSFEEVRGRAREALINV